MTKARDIASAAPAPSTVSATELGYLDGVTSNIQTQIDSKTGGVATDTPPASPTEGQVWLDTDGTTADANFSLTSHNHNSDYIAKTLTTTTGDIIYASAANTPARLAIGSTNQVLTVSGGLPVWAAAATGGMTSLASGNINNSVSLTSISGSYNALYLVLNNYVPSTADTGGVRINNDTTATNYVGVNMRNITGTGATVNQMSSVSFVDICAGSSILSPSTQNQAVVYFPNYANTSAWKVAYSYNGHNNNLSTYTSGTSIVAYRSTSAITRLDLVTAGSSWNTQGTYELFGVK